MPTGPPWPWRSHFFSDWSPAAPPGSTVHAAASYEITGRQTPREREAASAPQPPAQVGSETRSSWATSFNGQFARNTGSQAVARGSQQPELCSSSREQQERAQGLPADSHLGAGLRYTTLRKTPHTTGDTGQPESPHPGQERGVRAPRCAIFNCRSQASVSKVKRQDVLGHFCGRGLRRAQSSRVLITGHRGWVTGLWAPWMGSPHIPKRAGP